MGEAKYKVGDEVETAGGVVKLRATIEAVRTLYRLRFANGITNEVLWDEHELTPYVPTLAVGDRVRWNRGRLVVEVICIKDNDAWVDNEGNRFTACIADLERIPTEAGQ